MIARGDGWTARLATPDDDAALRALVRSVPMEGAVTVAQEREPSFFALARATPGRCETFLAEDAEGRVIGCGTLALREGWFPDGSWRGVGQVSDLRVLPAWRGARVLPLLGRAALERARDAHGVEVLHAALVDANRRAVRAVTGRSGAREGQPLARPMTPYHMLSLPPGGRGDPSVERATPDDLDEVARFLDEGQRSRTFGHRVDRKLLESRLASWPGLRVEDFLLVRDGAGALAACAAPWDPSPLRSYRVLAYRGAARAYPWLARLLPGPGLPRAGERLRSVVLSHLEVRGDDPRLFARLLRAARAHAAPRRPHLVTSFVPLASPMRRAARGLLARRTPMTLFTLALPDGPWRGADFSTARPGFEMALA